MGSGNCCVHGKHEGLYYVDNNDIYVYSLISNPAITRLLRDIDYNDYSNWQYDEWLSDDQYQIFIENLTSDFTTRFPSFSKCDQWISKSLHARLENKLFYVCTEDNEWSVAVELIAKDDETLAGLQFKHYLNYLHGIRDTLFLQFSDLYVRTSAWTSGRIERPDKKELNKRRVS